MEVSIAKIECLNISDFETLHTEFDRVFGFPDFYGRNMNAWIDCLTDLDDPTTGMCSIHVAAGHTLALELSNAVHLKQNHPELLEAIIECSAFVNWRRVDVGEPPVISLCMTDMHVGSH